MNKLIEKHRNKFVNYATYKFTKGDKDLAEDLVQDTILKVLKNKDKFEEESNFEAWFYIILRNTFISHYIKSSTKAFKNSYGTEIAENLLGNSEENEYFKSNQEEELDKAIDIILSKRLAQLLRLHLNGYAYWEMAEIMDVPLGTVKNRLHVAKNRLVEFFKNKEIKV